MPQGRDSTRVREGPNTLEERHIQIVRNMMRVLLGILAVAFVSGVLVPRGLSGLVSIAGVLFLMVIALVSVAVQRLSTGNLNQAVIAVVSGGFVILGFITVRAGVVDPPYSYLFAYSLPLVFSALLVGRRGLVITGLVSILLVGGTFLAQRAGVPWVGVLSGNTDVGISLLIFALVMLLVGYFLDRLGVEVRLAHSRALGRERELANVVATLEEEIGHREKIEKERERLLADERAARKEAEELAQDNMRLALEVQDLNHELEARVEQRTRLLEEAIAEIRSVTEATAHDLRTPLRGIDGFAQVLSEEYGEVLDEEAMGYINRIRAGAGRVSELLDKINLLTQVTLVQLRLRDLDLGDLARQHFEEFQAQDAGREVTLQLSGDLVVSGDTLLLDSLLEQLIANAWTFTEGVPDACIEVGSLDEEGERVFYVRDNGVGFDMRYYDQLFLPFKTLHSGTRTRSTGIGLALAYRIVRKHNGRIWAKGEVGKGATVYFTLAPEGTQHPVQESTG